MDALEGHRRVDHSRMMFENDFAVHEIYKSVDFFLSLSVTQATDLKAGIRSRCQRIRMKPER